MGTHQSAMLEHVLDRETLEAALRRVRRNKGGPGSDGQRIDDFCAAAGAGFDQLIEDVHSGRYRPVRLRDVRIPKPKGGKRKLRIPAVRDRILQTAVLLVIMPSIEPLFHSSSFAYRPGRGVAHALAKVQEFAPQTPWVVDLDIADFFDTIRHALLRSDLAARIQDIRIYRLFLIWLKTFSRSGKGVAQGSPVSPLLSNIFLHPVDLQLEAIGINFVRYADDMLLFARSRSSAVNAKYALMRLLKERGLSINQAKSKIVSPGQFHVYLGQTYELAAIQ